MAITELQLLFTRCLHQRIGPNDFRLLLHRYVGRTGTSSKQIVSAFISCSVSLCIEGDPLLAQYLQTLVIRGFFRTAELLTALLIQWKGAVDGDDQISKLFSIHARLITDLNLIITAPGLENDTEKCTLLASRWLETLAKWAQDKSKVSEVNNLAEAVTILLISLLNNSVPGKAIYAAVQSALDQCMTVFPNVSMQLMAKMTTMPKSSVFGSQEQTDPSAHMMSMAVFEFESNIHDAPITACRNATSSYLNGLIRTGSTVDDSILFSFLNTRYQGNHATMFNELTLSSIDTMLRMSNPEDELYQMQCQIFMVNKLPSILAFIVTSTSAFEGFSSEDFLTQAFSYLNNAGNTNQINVGRQFLQICALYHLISNEVIGSLIGADGLNATKGLYAKDDLVNNVVGNHSRGPRLIEELLKNDGNAGVVSQAIVDIMHNYCHVKETQHLKDMANTIIRKPASINTMSMFIKPHVFLHPFCTLLDDWKWEEIHGESQPVYDEFGSVLLLILAFRQRLNLGNSELGIQQKEGFFAKYLASGQAEQDLSKLSDSTQSHLGDWIKSFYIDEGLSDDLTTNCSAQEFYLLVPTLLRQSMLAHSRGRLTSETLKAGLEFLLDPFLLPSLVSAFGWIEQIAEKEPQTALIVVQTLTKQVGTPEAQEIQQTILAMAADRLTQCGLSKNPVIGSIVLSMSKEIRFGMANSINESDSNSWRSIDGGISTLLSQNVAGQTSASSTVYNPKLLIRAVQTHGAKNVVSLFITLLLQFSGSQDFHPLLDFIATIISVGDVAIRNALQVLHTNLGAYLKKGQNLFAEVMIHLYRRVELYTTALSTQDLGMDHGFVPMAGLNVANVNLDLGAAPVFDQNTQVQTEDIDQVLNEAAVIGSMDQVDSSGFDEMYGLSSGDLGIGNLDDLDLEMF